MEIRDIKMENKDKDIPSPISGIRVWCVNVINSRNNSTISIAVFSKMETANNYARKQQGYVQSTLIEETNIDFPS